ncbi:hypothetical protein GEV33_012878 [Tenebrio molitor]|uniref:MD-2-related lipid-recognition domain-containing protein n=1 Tax=Tenebrio molitor TaxID=7067 RepID=A0A8J6H8A0_TENMO|nr:hypothetical protein GEV33_012878 [Tenebrio molitor]
MSETSIADGGDPGDRIHKDLGPPSSTNCFPTNPEVSIISTEASRKHPEAASAKTEVRYSGRDVDKILNTIHAYIAGVPFPYPGNDQTDACKNMYSEDGKNFVGCPLKKGQDYLYKNDMEVLQIYPRVKAVVHWGLTMPDDEFNIDAALLNDVSLNVRGTKFNLNVTPDDPCEVLLCPLSTNYSATYSAEVYIDTIFQPLNAELQWILETADAGEKLLCFLCQITLVNAKSV